MLDKRLKLGGLQVGGPRTMQNAARFRVADNVYQTLDDAMVPRFGNTDFITGLPADEVIIGIANYQLTPFFITRSTTDSKFHFYHGSATELKSPADMPVLTYPTSADLPSLGIQFVEEQGCLFFNIPTLGLYKFDGVHVYRAGVTTPWFSCAQLASAGATYVRVIQHHIDFQGNIVNSGYVEMRVTPDASGNIVLRTDQGTSDVIAAASTYDGISPKFRKDYDLPIFGEDRLYVSSSSFVTSGFGIVCTTGGNHNVRVGDYILAWPAYQTGTLVDGIPTATLAVAYQVSATDATTVTMSYDDAYYLDTSGQWKQANVFGSIFNAQASNTWFSVWTSNAATGNYVWKAICPSMFYSTATETSDINVASPTAPGAGISFDRTAFNLSGNLGDIYDVTTVKLPFPSRSEEFSSRAFCTYQDLALVAQENEIYFSDTSLGGSFEMVNGTSFIAVGGGNDGPNQTIQGTGDILFVSRQLKNYAVSGNLPTANYRVQIIPQTSLGAYSNESAIACLDKIIFVNKTGVWALNAGGRCDELSFNIKGLFDTFSETNAYNEETFWGLSDYPTYASGYNQWLRMRFDVSRNLLLIVVPGANKTGSILVLNLSNGEFYTWNDILHGVSGADFKDICPIEGVYYTNGVNALRKENKGVGKYDYNAGSSPTRLKTTWFTAGEPSLEKKLNQIKIFGLINANCTISHELDWKTNASIADETYVNSDSVLFSHKKRLTSANFLSVSVCVEPSTDLERFEIEGLEIEWQTLQGGMKK